MRNIKLIEGEYYHIYNRGVDKRIIFKNKFDFQRFLESIEKFNTTETIGSIFESQFNKREKLGHLEPKFEKLVDIVAYCLNPNHFHLILTPLVENGISRFMHKLGMGYTNHFNEKYKRPGSLFQGSFKAVHIDTDEYLMLLSVYVNLNFKVHGLHSKKDVLYKSSWLECFGKNKGKKICNTEIFLKRFKKVDEYKKYANSALKGILERKELYKDIEN